MPVSDLDIARSAHLWIQRQGDVATAKACEMVEASGAEMVGTWRTVSGRSVTVR
jgi:hypothetical protein